MKYFKNLRKMRTRDIRVRVDTGNRNVQTTAFPPEMGRFKLERMPAQLFRFLRASGLFEMTMATVGHVSISGQSPQVSKPFFNAH